MGERIAKKYLQNKNYLFLNENFYTRFGELDLIFLDGETLVFVEVKTRSNLKYGFPAQAINKNKLKHIYLASEIFLSENPQYQDKQLRIDAVSILYNDFKNYQIKHYKNLTLGF